jgi:hypothetical protein
MASQEDTKFDHQAFLASHIDDISQNIVNNFEYISTIDTQNKSLSETFALLTGKTEEFSFTKLKSHQYSALLPKVRLFRVDSNEDGDKEYEFLFRKDTSYNENVLGENLIRDNSAGIKSINWTLAGTNPTTAQKSIECSVEFYFSSINAFSGGDYDKMLEFWNGPTKDFTKSGFDGAFTTRNYWALLFHPTLPKEGYETTKFRIKAVIGWESIGNNIKQELFMGMDKIEDELQDSNLSMYLNLVRHEFSFNEDGSIKIKADYIGSLENAMFNYNYDLFRGLKKQINDLNSGEFTNVTFKIESGSDVSGVTREYETVNLSKQQKKLKLLSDLRTGLSTEGCDSTQQIALIEKLKKAPASAYEDYIEEQEKELKRIEDIYKEEEVKIKNTFYSSLVERLLDKEDGKVKLYLISLLSSDITQWINWKNREVDTATNEEPSSKVPVISLGPIGFSDSVRTAEQSLQNLSVAATTTPETEASVISQDIYYTTVGNLLDAAHSIIEKGSIKDGPSESGGPLEAELLKEFKRNKIVFSCLDNDSKVNIANIPIAFNSLLEFFLEKIYKPQKMEYSLYQFIKDVITALVEPAINLRSVANSGINQYSNTSLATNIITLKSKDKNIAPLDPFIKRPIAGGTTISNNNIVLDGKVKKDIKPYYPSNSQQGNYYFYYFIYDIYLKDFGGKGNLVEDSKRGIYHYTIGQDYGLIKSINFKKSDQPYLRESKSIGKKTIYLGQFRDIYQASVNMVGNNIYTPGMILLLKPSIEFGNVIGSVDQNSKPSFSQITGVGGYYSVIKASNTIDENGFSTSLECLFHSNEPKRKKEEKEKACQQELIDLLADPEFNDLLQEVKAVVKEEEAKVAAVEAFKEASNEFIKDTKEFLGDGIIADVVTTVLAPFGVGFIPAVAGASAAVGAYFGTNNNDTINPETFEEQEKADKE